MMRFYNFAAIFAMLGSAFVLYSFNYDTRFIETQVRSLERQVDLTQSDIAILKAEKAHLSRPDRIESFARRLGLQSLKPSQIRDVSNSQTLKSSKMN